MEEIKSFAGTKFQWRFSFLITFFLMLSLSIWNYNNRMYDWDMPGYMACFYTILEPNQPEKIHHRIYQEIKKEAPQKEYQDIIGIDRFDTTRQWFTKNTQSFTEQLPYFQIKIGYNLTLLALYKIGFSGPMSITILSIISYFVSGLLLFWVLKIIFPRNPWLNMLLTVCICLLPPMTHMSRISTPDLFIFQFLMLFMVAFLQKWSSWKMFIIHLLIIFVRPDYIPFSLSYYAFQWIFEYLSAKKINYHYISYSIVLTAMYVAILMYYNYPGWKDLFYDTFIYRRPFISTQKADFTLAFYFKFLLSKFLYFKKVTVISIALLIGTFYFTKDRFTRLFAVCFFINIYIKFVFFPQSAALRFFFPTMALLLLMFLSAFSKKYPNVRIRKIA